MDRVLETWATLSLSGIYVTPEDTTVILALWLWSFWIPTLYDSHVYCKWVAVPSSRGSSLPKDQTRISYVSCIVRQFTTSATWETQTLLSIYPEMELLDHMAILFLIFGGTAIPFSTVAVPSYILTNSVKGLQFLHILAIIFCFLDFW